MLPAAHLLLLIGRHIVAKALEGTLPQVEVLGFVVHWVCGSQAGLQKFPYLGRFCGGYFKSESIFPSQINLRVVEPFGIGNSHIQAFGV